MPRAGHHNETVSSKKHGHVIVVSLTRPGGFAEAVLLNQRRRFHVKHIGSGKMMATLTIQMRAGRHFDDETTLQGTTGRTPAVLSHSQGWTHFGAGPVNLHEACDTCVGGRRQSGSRTSATHDDTGYRAENATATLAQA